MKMVVFVFSEYFLNEMPVSLNIPKFPVQTSVLNCLRNMMG